MNHEKFMSIALREASKNMKHPKGGPFGACIVRQGTVLAKARNTVLDDDATCHAEINAIRIASRKLGSHDLSGCIIYSTTEPCPMCFSAIHWSGIKTIYYGTTVADAKKTGFNELLISNSELKKASGVKIHLYPGIMNEKCMELFNDWRRMHRNIVY